MADQIRTKCGQKLQKKISASKVDYITIYIKRSYRFCIQSALTIKGYLEQFFDGVPFRGRAANKNVLKSLYNFQGGEDLKDKNVNG